MSVTTPDQAFERDPMELQAAADGVPVDEVQYVDYFGFGTTDRFFLPDGQQYFEIKVLNEGEKSALESGGSREVVVQRRTGDAKMKIDPARDRHALIRVAVASWNLKTKDSRGRWIDLPFDDRNMARVLKEYPPLIIEDLEKAIRKLNPTLGGERSVEDIQAEIATLKEELEEAEKREAGKLDS